MICQNCGAPDSPLNPVRPFRERVTATSYRTAYQCVNVVACWARRDRQHRPAVVVAHQATEVGR